jgi:hypothetical protein
LNPKRNYAEKAVFEESGSYGVRFVQRNQKPDGNSEQVSTFEENKESASKDS